MKKTDIDNNPYNFYKKELRNAGAPKTAQDLGIC